MSSGSAHITTSGPIVTNTHSWNMGVPVIVLTCNQWNFVGSSIHKGWCWRSVVWTCFKCSFRSVASVLCSLLSITVTLEDIAGIVLNASSSHCIDWTMESCEFSTYCSTVGIHIWTYVSRIKNTYVELHSLHPVYLLKTVVFFSTIFITVD